MAYGDQTPARVSKVRLDGVLGEQSVRETRRPEEWNDVLSTVQLRSIGDGRVHVRNICGDVRVDGQRIGAAQSITLEPGAHFQVNGLVGQIIDRAPHRPS